jgi:hypothetical protein
VPFILIHVIVLAVSVEILGIVAANCIDAVHVSVVDGSEITSRVIEESSVLKTFLLLDVL